jgi:hypothetical protein
LPTGFAFNSSCAIELIMLPALACRRNRSHPTDVACA